jgi:hypothetical protein
MVVRVKPFAINPSSSKRCPKLQCMLYYHFSHINLQEEKGLKIGECCYHKRTT